MAKQATNYPVEYYEWTWLANYTAKHGVESFQIGSIKPEGHEARVFTTENLVKHPATCYAELTMPGPAWDVLSCIEKFVVSSRLHDFLAERSGDEFLFKPLEIRENGKLAYQYHLAYVQHTIPAIENFLSLKRQVLVDSGLRVLRACDTKDECRNVIFIRSDFAEEMIDAGFSGLGFKNAFSSHKPGTRGNQKRMFPEEASFAEYVRSSEDRLLTHLIGQHDDINAAWISMLGEPALAPDQAAADDLRQRFPEQDFPSFLEWLQITLSTPPPYKTKACWLGLNEGTGRCCVYLGGSAGYDEEAKFDFDWASDLNWSPVRACFCSANLDRILAYFKDGDKVSCNLAAGYAALLLRLALQQLPPESYATLGRRKRPVAAGWDNGDAFFIGTVTPKGWSRKF